MIQKRAVLYRAIELASGVAAGWILSESEVKNVLILIPTVLVSLAFVDDYRRSRQARHREIEMSVRSLMESLALDPRFGARCTVHVPIGALRKRFLQACPYVPGDSGAGRRFRRRQGIIWKAYEAKAERTESFHSDEEYRNRMTSEYNYSTQEMLERTTDRRSYYCGPIIETDDVLGLLYLDAREPDVFPLPGEVDRSSLVATAKEALRNVLLG